MTAVWILQMVIGSYDDAYTATLGIFTTEEAALKERDRVQAKMEEYKQLPCPVFLDEDECPDFNMKDEDWDKYEAWQDKTDIAHDYTILPPEKILLNYPLLFTE